MGGFAGRCISLQRPCPLPRPRKARLPDRSRIATELVDADLRADQAAHADLLARQAVVGQQGAPFLQKRAQILEGPTRRNELRQGLATT